MRRDLQCTFRRPGLVSVRSQHAISDELVKRGQVSAVGGEIETDFQLERAMSSAQGSFRHLPRARRINAAGIDPDLVAVTAQHLPQRHVAATRAQIPNREIDPCDRLRKGTELTGLQREYRGALCQGVEDIRRVVRSKSRQRGRQHFVDEPCPVFRASRRKVCPDLTPADLPIFIFDANEHGGAIQHPAERGDDRRR